MGPDWGPYFLAGGEGFEPPLTESESVVLPLDDPPVDWLDAAASDGLLALRVLRCATCFAQAHFLALDFTRVAGHEASLAQRRAQ